LPLKQTGDLVTPQANFFHVDVFAKDSLTGNGLAVFLDVEHWSVSVMQQLTREMKQFESIFLSGVSPRGATARVFTVEEELPYAGHPVLGAAAVLHRTQLPESDTATWKLKLPGGEVSVNTRKIADHYRCEMNQGAPEFGQSIRAEDAGPFLTRLGLGLTDAVTGMTAQVVSTGLPYLIIPVLPGALAKAAITGTDLEALLARFGARFILALDIENLEMRTWDNFGKVEDVATGSAAGPAAAFLLRLGLADPGLPIELAQGRFAGRPSKITVVRERDGSLLVSGEVWPVIRGVLEIERSALTLRS
jgi:PhzF family phenazine biosynthesis protein